VTDTAAAVEALGEAPRRVFVTLGKTEIGTFARAPQHHYLVRSVEPVDPPLAVVHSPNPAIWHCSSRIPST
jgi:precorrin-6A/cobalt-precorrin-6A reductase